MTARTLADPCGVEVCALQKHVACGVVCTAALAAKHTCYAHGFLGIADGQVALAQFVLHTVQGNKGSSLGHGLHHHLAALYHVCVEAVQGLAVCHHYVVGNVHDVVDGAQAYDAQTVLQPFGAFLHLASGQCQGAIAGTSLGGLHRYGNLQVSVVHLECIA